MARPGLDRHPKFRTLCRLLGEPRPHVWGYLEMLWQAAYENGEAVIGSALQVEAVAEFTGKAGLLAESLATCGGPGRAGFIEPVPGKLELFQVHDLFQNAPEYVKKRKAREDARNGKSPEDDDPPTDDVGGETADSGGRCPPLSAERQTVAENGAPPCTLHPARKEKRKSAASPFAPAAFLAEWNATPGVRKAKAMTKKRLVEFHARTADAAWLADYSAALDRVAASDFCRGTNDRGWIADIDFFLRDGTVTMILEGKYDNRPTGTNGHAKGTDIDAALGPAWHPTTEEARAMGIYTDPPSEGGAG